MSDDPTQLPIACSLDAAGLGEQERRWTELIGATGTGRVATSDGVELHFRDEDAVERELTKLVAVERECCAWARWEIERTDDRLVMRARASNDGAAALRLMFRPDA